MRLKRLEMVGFKSFADKTRVEFEPGITAVVGPNGCGKSNISDAIRWSLGEMSARSLRSQQMLDVIFSGTATRAAQGMSEVSLTFDNTSHLIPLDYTEVTVARRLFRSGESEYFINKTQCRLKDIRDLFLDTGVGNDGYYVMAQGKIEFLLSAKPEERRELFEEAAGVSKYKVRREEALRKLAKVEQDMLRLNDSLAIYKQQIDALESAVRKAKQHQKLQEDLKRLEIASLLSGHRKAQTEWEAVHLKQEEEAR
jgi:chromosome segregation protein